MFRNASLLTGSAAVAQAIQMVALIALTALYSPAAFGELAIASNASAIVAVIVGLQLPFAIPITSDNPTLNRVLAVLRLNTILAIGLSSVLAILWGSPYSFAMLIGSAVCLGNTMKAYAIADQKPTMIAHYYFWRAGLIIGLQLALSPFGAVGLVLGLAVGELLASLFLSIRVHGRFFTGVGVSVSAYRSTIVSFRSFTVFGVFQESIAILVVLIPFLIADRLFTSAEVGNFGMAYRFTWGPVAIIGTNVGWLVLGALGRDDTRAHALLRSWKTIAGLISTVTVAGLALAFVSRIALEIHSFEEWSLAVTLLPIVGLSALSFLASTPYRQVIRARYRQNVQLGIDAITCISLLILAIVPQLDMTTWVFGASVIVLLQNFITMLYGHRLAGAR